PVAASKRRPGHENAIATSDPIAPSTARCALLAGSSRRAAVATIVMRPRSRMLRVRGSTVGDRPVVPEVVESFVQSLREDVVLGAARCGVVAEISVELDGAGVPTEREVRQPQVVYR